MRPIIIKSSLNSRTLVNYPTISWVLNNILRPILTIALFLFLIFFLALLVFSRDTGIAWVIPLVLLTTLYLIPRAHLKKGNAEQQTIKLEGKTLTVVNRIFPMSRTDKYIIEKLEIQKVKTWNLLTGKDIKTNIEYGQLKINDDILIQNLFKVDELNKLIRSVSRI